MRRWRHDLPTSQLACSSILLCIRLSKRRPHGGANHDNQGDHYGQTIANENRVEQTATFIADELKVLLDRNNINSHMSRRIRETCPAYRDGLTNAERVLATMRALSAVQLELCAELASLEVESDDDGDDGFYPVIASGGAIIGHITGDPAA